MSVEEDEGKVVEKLFVCQASPGKWWKMESMINVTSFSASRKLCLYLILSFQELFLSTPGLTLPLMGEGLVQDNI